MLFKFQIQIKYMLISFNLIPNKSKKWAIKLSSEIETFLKSKGYIKSLSPDFSIVIGGDGSFYYNLSRVKGKVILIGSESTYRSQIKKDEWKLKLIKLIKRNKYVKLPLISVYKNGKLIGEGVNDIVFHSKDFKVSNFSIVIKNKSMSFRGDGLIMSTPFGSTAYSYSAGGPKLNLMSNKFILTPICPYLRTMKPLSFDNINKIQIKCDGNALLMIDGIIKSKKCTGEYVLEKSKNKIEFVN
jgi:NAD+ kinase